MVTNNILMKNIDKTSIPLIVWGLAAQSHDASLAVLRGEELVYAAHAERYSRKKNDPNLNQNLIGDALQLGEPDLITWYESPFLKYTRQVYYGRWKIDKLFPKEYLKFFYNKKTKFVTTNHHLSHAAGGYYTSQFERACIIVVDAIGEWTTTSIWKGSKNELKMIYSQKYPNSIGLWYSAMTHRCGLKPNQDEYILMGMSALGDPERFYSSIKKTFFSKIGIHYKLRHNLHWGCKWWMQNELTSEQDIFDVAAATQKLFEEIILDICHYAYNLTKINNLVLAGGCALNCVANSLIAQQGWNDIWIMPNPGDAGSSLGAILAYKKQHINWPGPYLGYCISGKYPVRKAINSLINEKVTGIANGKAEFGPRALGNRSLLADPRGHKIKDLVNQYKKREPFRPFAPAILEEYANQYFVMPVNKSPYMQYVAKCIYPEEFPAIVHCDGTSRIQTVDKTSNPGFRKLLEEWFEITGCPMLLNTSLNIKNEPLVNNEKEAINWSKENNLSVHCRE